MKRTHGLVLLAAWLLAAAACSSDTESSPPTTESPPATPTTTTPTTPTTTTPIRDSVGQIAFVSERDGNQEVYVMDADGSNQTRLTNNPAYDGLPVWSPVG